MDRVRLGLVAVSALSILAVLPAQAETHEISPALTQPVSEVQDEEEPSLVTSQSSLVEDQSQVTTDQRQVTNDSIPQLSEIEQPTTTIVDWIAQIEASLVQITGVRVEETETGFQVILETADGSLQVPETRSIGNALIADITNAAIAEEFSQANPIEGIALVSVTSLPGDRVRVAITGTDALPVAEVRSEGQGLVLAVALGDAGNVAEEDAIQVVVTGDQEEGYYVPDASVGTRTNTPLRDIPQSIQVIPQEVLRDQNVTNLTEALRNVPGAGFGNTSRSLFNSSIILRGFFSGTNVLRNGLNENPSNNTIGFEAAGIEQIEVLRGPASVLYGQGGLGGTINYATKQPLIEPYYSLEASAGNFNFYRGAVDLSGPLNDSQTVLYRLNLAAQTTESFFDFYDAQRFFVAPTLSWQISDRTRLTLAAEYLSEPQSADQNYGVPAVGTVLPNPNGEISRNRNIGEADNTESLYTTRIGYDLEHRFSENWQIRNALRFLQIEAPRSFTFGTALADDNRTLSRRFASQSNNGRSFNSDTYVVGEFSTGSIRHELVTGVNLTRQESDFGGFARQASPIDLFNPVYGQPLGDETSRFDASGIANTLGIYVQDQITLAENLKLLLGVRFDTFSQTEEDRLANTETSQSGNAFSPRVGIVYQPIEPISLYASYSRSFTPTFGTSFDGDVFQPERGTQYEVGVKADLTNQLSTTLALYELTRFNVLTEDTDNPGFSIQTGEQRSRGVELTLQGEILPGWNVIAGYAYTDARVVEDNTLSEGLRFRAVPENTFNLWTTYEIQEGDFQGLGLGLGLFFVGEREGDTLNTFQLPSYLRTDAALFYRRDRFRVALNIRNLFNVDYIETSLNELRVFRGDPLTVQGTISFEF